MASLQTNFQPNQKSYRFLLKELSDNLTKRDLRIINFLCADIAPGSDNLKNGLAIWKTLEDKGYLGPNDYGLLAEILYLAGRTDLALKIAEDEEKVANRIRTGDTKLTKFR